MDLRQIEYFLAVVDHGGVTRAAAAIRVAQPSLSQAIRALEHDLGVELFSRAGRGMALAPAGQALVAPARQVLSDLAEARSAVRQVASLASGRLDIAADPALAIDPVAPVLARFRQRYPEVRLRLHEPRDDDHLVRLLAEGYCELALTYLPVPGEGLVVSELGVHEICVVLPPDAAAVPDPLPIAALGAVPRVAGIRVRSALHATVTAGLRAAGVQSQPAVLTQCREAVAPLVRSGAGATFQARCHAEASSEAGAVIRRLTPPIRCTFGLVHRPASLSPAARAFTALLRKALAAGDLATH